MKTLNEKTILETEDDWVSTVLSIHKLNLFQKLASEIEPNCPYVIYFTSNSQWVKEGREITSRIFLDVLEEND